MEPKIFKNPKMVENAKPFREPAKKLLSAVPTLEWDLKKAGYEVSGVEYLAVILYMATIMFCAILLAMGGGAIASGRTSSISFPISFCGGRTGWMF